MQPVDSLAQYRDTDNLLDKLYSKAALRLIPFLCLCYIAAYLDRINIGFAKLQMLKELNLGEAAFGFGAGIFFVGYILFEVPSNVVLQKTGAKIWIGLIMVAWGILSFATMFVTTPMQFYVLRFLLGVAEAGFLPGVLFYLTTWFPANRRSRVLSFFMIGVPLSSLIGGPLSGYVMGHFDKLHGLAGWQWLFLLESVPSIVFGVLIFNVLPNSLDDASWLTRGEKSLLTRALQDDTDERRPQLHRWRDGILDYKIWMLGGIDFSILLSTYALGFWMPTFIKDAGASDLFYIGVLTAIPAFAGTACMLLIAASSDRRRERRWHIILPLFVGAASMAASTLFTSNVVATVLLFAIASGATLGAVPVFFSLPTTFLSGAAAAAGLAMACSLANIAGLVGNSLMGLILQLTQSSSGAILSFAACLFISCFLAFALPAEVVNR